MRALQLIDDRKLEITDLPEPEAPAAGEVTLRVKAVALNHIDVWGWRGMAFAKRKMPLVIGAEASGVVESIGPGVSNVLPGQQNYLCFAWDFEFSKSLFAQEPRLPIHS
jgi:alcohol dehydrogenase